MEVFQYVPFKSFVNPNFWYKFADIKIDIDRLNDQPRKIYGFYTNQNAKNCLVEVDCTSFNENFTPAKNNFIVNGTLINKNTIEQFKNCDKSELLKQWGHELWANITSGAAIENPSLLINFFILSFADLKTHKFYYWFAFPSPINPIVRLSEEIKSITKVFSRKQIDELNHLYSSNSTVLDAFNKSFFIVELEHVGDDNDGGGVQIWRLQDKINAAKWEENFINASADKLNDLYFCFADPSEYENPGWSFRIFIAMLTKLCPNLHGKSINLISIRCNKSHSIENSIHYRVQMPNENENFEGDMKWIGWELNDHSKLLPKMVNMGATMDPKSLADNSCNLNLKLMKWRLLPDLDIELIQKTKCLLVGAGTLGCGVARTLLGWGVKHITFIDSGKVHYSNPVRQSLYTHEDAVAEKYKAIAAQERLVQIHPALTVNGYVGLIPMPGHPVGESTLQSTQDNITLLEEQIKEHDAVFLLTDSRESRWLPTLLGAYYDKIVINTALGFDSYVIMRHGSRKQLADENSKFLQIDGLKCISGNRLGCYFCNDITAPGDSMKDRTLDQQCTVTRPSVSNIASSIAVELLISLVQHEHRNLAPAYIAAGGNIEKNHLIPEGLLGIIPHSIRGMMSTFQQIIPATEHFPQCIACSSNVLAEYGKRGHNFIIDVLNSTKYLEDLTGITDYGANVENDIIAFDDDDEEFDIPE